jgi:hypothetical protein
MHRIDKKKRAVLYNTHIKELIDWRYMDEVFLDLDEADGRVRLGVTAVTLGAIEAVFDCCSTISSSGVVSIASVQKHHDLEERECIYK